jgi:lysophospholipase
MVSSREGMITGAQDTQLFWRWWDAPRARGFLLLVHGHGEHSGRFAELALRLTASGIAVCAFDLRGHGRSQGPRGDVGAFPHFLQDLLAVEELMDREIPAGLPRFLMGHSLGGLVCLKRLQAFHGPYAGAILSAPWLATALPPWAEKAGTLLGLFLPGVPFPSGIVPEKLTRDPEMIREWRRDPLIHSRITPRLFREVVRVQREVLGFQGAMDLPLLFLIPGADPVVRSAVTETFARRVVGRIVEVEILHGYLHEALNDVGREEVHALVVKWLEARMSVLPADSPGG